MSASTDNKEPLFLHIAILRKYLIQSLIIIAAFFSIAVFFAKDLYQILSLPLRQVLPGNSHFITTHPIEAWFTYLKTAFFTSVFLSLPVLIFFLWKFIAPGLFDKEKKTFVFFSFSSALLFLAGSLFGYFVIFPFCFDYFAGILEGTDILFLPSMENYLGFSFRLLIASGIIFETPIFIIFLVSAGIVSLQSMIGFQRYYILLAFFLSSLLTPPDVISQVILGIPMVALYEVGLLIAWLLCRDSEHTTHSVKS